jgi:hypothetical protein
MARCGDERSAALAARVAKRREELERSRRLGLALLTWKRFREIEIDEA